MNESAVPAMLVGMLVGLQGDFLAELLAGTWDVLLAIAIAAANDLCFPQEK